MLSTDFAYRWEEKRPWDEWYEEEIVNNEMYKTLYILYKGQQYQYQATGYRHGEIINGKLIKEESYMFFKLRGKRGEWELDSEIQYFDSFKDAIDDAKLDDGKIFKEIWDDPDGEVLDFS